MFVSERIALNPNKSQETHFQKAAGTARFAYNWALAEWKRKYEAGEKPTAFKLCKQFNAIKRERFPWATEVTWMAPNSAILNLGEGFRRFFSKASKYPRFKKKNNRASFEIHCEEITLEANRVRIPKLGWVRTHHDPHLKGQIKTAHISRQGHRWFLSVAIETENPFPQSENQAAVGVDLGITAMATISTGEKLTGPKPHRALSLRLRRLNKAWARKDLGSSNKEKARRKLSRLHARIRNIRHHAIHQITNKLTRDFGVIGIENLNVRGMVRNRRLARSISDMGFCEFKRQLRYKAAWRGVRVVEVERFYPSSKTCSVCGRVAESLPLAIREWSCACGAHHDRDINAAINLRNKAVESTVSACGDSSSGPSRKIEAKLPSMNQEFASMSKKEA